VTNHDDFHTEPVPGLPAHLPDGEKILWQGKPEIRPLFVTALHGRKVAIYFVILAIWKLISSVSDGKAAAEIAFSVGGTLVLAGLVLALLYLLTYLIARTTIYTITNKRLVMRFGVALPITFQFPFSQIDAADVMRIGRDGGNIAFTLKEHTKVSWAVLWPHVRAWKVARPQPTIRAVADVLSVSSLLADLLKQAHQQTEEYSKSRETAARPQLDETKTVPVMAPMSAATS